MVTEIDSSFMQQALELAQQAADSGEVPVGAVVVLNGEVIGRGFNHPISSCDPTAHAEIMAIRDAAQNIGNYRLTGAELYVTLEPCSMCAGALIHSRIKRVIYGTTEPKAGVLVSQGAFLDQSWLNHRVGVSGPLLQQECSQILSDFFKQRRAQNKLKK